MPGKPPAIDDLPDLLQVPHSPPYPPFLSARFNRNEISMGGKKDFINAVLPGHLNTVRQQKIGRALMIKTPT